MRFRATMLAVVCGVAVSSSIAFGSEVPAGGASPSEAPISSSLSERLLAENPNLVDELLKGAIDQSENSSGTETFLFSIYALGSPAVEKVLPHINSPDQRMSAVASQTLMMLMTLDDFPLEKAVPHFMKMTSSEDPAVVEMGRALLAYSITYSMTEARQAMQAEFRKRLSGK